jgi:hypothetical protein
MDLISILFHRIGQNKVLYFYLTMKTMRVSKTYIFNHNKMLETAQYFLLSQPPLWSSGQGSWLQIQRCAFESRRFLVFWEVVGLEQGPLNLVSTI